MTAILSFTAIRPEDDGDYSCIIITVGGFSVNTIRVIVANPGKTLNNCIYIRLLKYLAGIYCYDIL